MSLDDKFAADDLDWLRQVTDGLAADGLPDQQPSTLWFQATPKDLENLAEKAQEMAGLQCIPASMRYVLCLCAVFVHQYAEMVASEGESQ